MSEELEKLKETIKEYEDLFVKEKECKGCEEPWYMSLWCSIPLFPFYYIVQEIKSMKRMKGADIDCTYITEIWFFFILQLVSWMMIYFVIGMGLYYVFTNLTVAIICGAFIAASLIFFVLPIYLINKYVTKNR